MPRDFIGIAMFFASIEEYLNKDYEYGDDKNIYAIKTKRINFNVKFKDI